MPKLRTKNAQFGYFWAGISNIAIFATNTIKFNKNEFLTYTVNFGVGSAFFKGPGPGPSPPYKVYRTEIYNLKHTALQSFISL